MVTASIEVPGFDAERLARELRANLASGSPGESVAPVEVDRAQLENELGRRTNSDS